MPGGEKDREGKIFSFLFLILQLHVPHRQNDTKKRQDFQSLFSTMLSTENLLFVVDVQVVGGRLWKNDSWQDEMSGCVFALSRGFAVGNIF
jgi:hypothetical protein